MALKLKLTFMYDFVCVIINLLHIQNHNKNISDKLFLEQPFSAFLTVTGKYF